MTTKILLTAVFALTLATACQAQTPQTGRAPASDAPTWAGRLDQFFDRLAEKKQAMGSLVIVKDGSVIYSRSIGYSQVDGAVRKPLTAANRFRIASITKMYTATMILQLVEEGKLRLTETLDKFYPQVPNAGKITMLQILNHRSGIPNVHREQNAQGNANTLPITKDEILALITKATPGFEPDTQSSYSNSGYSMLGLIIEKVTGKSYAAVLEERINAKAGLKETYVATGNIEVGRNEALTYIINPGGDWRPMPETHPSVLFGGGSIISTPAEMAKFIEALFDGKLVSPESVNRMKTMRDGEGLGMEKYDWVGRTFYGHAGGGDNYGSWLAYRPEERLAIAYLTNAKVYAVPEIMKGIAAIYYNQPFQIPSFDAVAVTAEVLEKYVGVYSSTQGPVKFTISRKDTTLFVQPGAQTPGQLEATAEDTFTIVAGVTLRFDAAKGQMIMKRPNGEMVFTKDK